MNIEEAKQLLQSQFDYAKKYNREVFPSFAIHSEVANALKVLLNAPIMPEHPSDELLQVMKIYSIDGNVYNTERYNALRAALLTPPKPKMKTVWKLAYTDIYGDNQIITFEKECEANEARTFRVNDVRGYTNISPIWSEEVEDK